MKKLAFVTLTILAFSFNTIAQDWPANSSYVYFGADTLDQTQAGNYALLQKKADGLTYLNSPNHIRFRINNQERMILTSAGRIGIGTTSPNAKLHVYGNSAGDGNPLASLMIGLNNGTEIEAIQEGNDPDRQSMSFRVKASQTNADPNQEAMRIKYNGYVGIGTIDPKSRLSVNGQIRATEVKVLANITVPDYVFEEDYNLRSLEETKDYITENKHLPEIPSAAEISKNGIDLGDMNMRLLKKIEELTLYLLAQNEELAAHKMRIEELERKLTD
ncbi:MAG: hypothetical protein KI790_16435 [Cyclobacteriaceae bacterium]|nr:hypothetical protein [Cyclobacteriaceae bacterium HetDA_MAG_MS6]